MDAFIFLFTLSKMIFAKISENLFVLFYSPHFQKIFRKKIKQIYKRRSYMIFFYIFIFKLKKIE